jgi:hypothetical protein
VHPLYSICMWGGGVGGVLSRGEVTGEVTTDLFTNQNRFLLCIGDIEKERYTVDLVIHVNLSLFIRFTIYIYI